MTIRFSPNLEHHSEGLTIHQPCFIFFLICQAMQSVKWNGLFLHSEHSYKASRVSCRQDHKRHPTCSKKDTCWYVLGMAWYTWNHKENMVSFWPVKLVFGHHFSLHSKCCNKSMQLTKSQKTSNLRQEGDIMIHIEDGVVPLKPQGKHLVRYWFVKLFSAL